MAEYFKERGYDMKLINVPTDRKVIVEFRDALHVLTEDELSSIIDSKVFIVKFSDILEQCVDESIIKRRLDKRT